MRLFISTILFISFLTISKQSYSTIYINEILASNMNAFENPQTKDFVDIIELYNSGSTAIYISGYSLTDDKNNIAKWKIPAGTTIAAGGYLIFYADGTNTGFHTNFKLDTKGEFIGLYNSTAVVVDSFSYGIQRADISYGRNASTPSKIGYFEKPTIGTKNGNTNFSGFVENPTFTVAGGFFNSSQILSFVTQLGTDIYYTTDGSTPSASKTKYTNPVSISKTTVVRAIKCKPDFLNSDIVTATFFINTPRNLPSLSIVTDPGNFFSDDSGIYVIGTNGIAAGCSNTPMNVNQDWERPVNLEYFDKTGVRQINQMAGAKIFGGCSRQRYPIKSLSFFSRSVYGKSSFDYAFFNNRPFKSYDGIQLRSGSDDQVLTTFRDAVSHLLCDDLEIETQAYQPVAVYINGEYWGIQNLREKYNEDYFNHHYGISPEKLNVVERNPKDSWSADYGSAKDYVDMINIIENKNNSATTVFNEINKRIDMESYIDYQTALIYMGMDDWPSNNIKYWKADSGQYNKWRWICWDLDHTLKQLEQNWSWMGVKAQNTLELAALEEDASVSWPNPQWSTLLFRTLLKNNTFKNEFIQSIAYQMNTTFDSTRIIHIVDSIAGNIEPEIPRHCIRWGGQSVPNPESWIYPIFETVDVWKQNVEVYRYFARNRRALMTDYMKSFFKLSGTATLTIQKSSNDAGYIKIIRKTIKTNQHKGDYFLNIPLTIKAIPAVGFTFVQWEITPLGSAKTINSNATISFTPSKNTTLKAIFEKTSTNNGSVVITEINYNSLSTANSGDWVELYNTSDADIDISGWKLRDGTMYNFYTVPSSTILTAGSYIVICEDSLTMRKIYPNENPIIGNLLFGFDNSGETIRLYDAGNKLIDSVKYNDKAPWPTQADGLGYSLQLKSPELDNSLATNWIAKKPTPASSIATESVIISSLNENILYQNSPNPSKSTTSISYFIAKTSNVVITISNITGKTVGVLNEGKQSEGYHSNTCDISFLPSGFYLYSLSIDGNIVSTKKMIIQ